MQLTVELFFCVLCFAIMCIRASVEMSLSNASQPNTKVTGCEILLYVVLYSAKSWYISQKKQLGYELVQLFRPWIYFFNVIVSYLIALKTLKGENFWDFSPCDFSPYGSAPDLKLQLQLFFLYKTKSFSTKQTLVKVLAFNPCMGLSNWLNMDKYRRNWQTYYSPYENFLSRWIHFFRYLVSEYRKKCFLFKSLDFL